MVTSPEVSSFTTIREHFQNFKKQKSGDSFLQYLVDNTSAEDLSSIASLEQGTSEWKEARMCRITASNAGAVRSLRDINKCDSLLNNIVNGSNIKTVQTDHGILNEPFARNMYRIDESAKHKDLRVSEHGLIVSQEAPYLGASPDAIAECSCCNEKRVVEIKCPFNGKDDYPIDIPGKFPKCYLKVDRDGKLRVKESSPWYSQAIFQMGVLNVNLCHFVIHTVKETTVIPINFDVKLWKLLKAKATNVFVQRVIPKL